MTPLTADLDVFKSTRRCLIKAGDGLRKADNHAFGTPDRLLHMHDTAQLLRKAAHEIDRAALAERRHNEDGFSVYQLDFEGAATPILIGVPDPVAA